MSPPKHQLSPPPMKPHFMNTIPNVWLKNNNDGSEPRDHQCSLCTVQWFLFGLVSVRSATVTRPVRRPAVEVLWPTAQTSLWPPRCQSWPAWYVEPNQPSVSWSPGPAVLHSHWFPTVIISQKMSLLFILYRSWLEISHWKPYYASKDNLSVMVRFQPP